MFSVTTFISQGRGRWLLAGSAPAVALIANQSPAVARGGICDVGPIECGAVLDQDCTYVLHSDIKCPAYSSIGTAVTVIGPAKLNLRGHSVHCEGDSDLPDGIKLDGTGARVLHGSVHDCDNGVAIEGEGQHKIMHMKVSSNAGRGMRLKSAGNVLIGNWVKENKDDGVHVDEGSNFHLANKILANGGQGLRIESNGNRVWSNHISANVEENVKPKGDKNVFVYNLVSASEKKEGFQIDGDRNELRHNLVWGNHKDGIVIRGSKNRISRNTVKKNGTGTFDEDQGTEGPKVDAGIEVNRAGSYNTITHNWVFGNDPVDMVDQNLGCDDDIWSDNHFDSSLLYVVDDNDILVEQQDDPACIN